MTAASTALARRRAMLGFERLSHLEPARELVAAIQELSLASSTAEIQEIVRSSARRLAGADGATFVLRDGPSSYYADEDAVAPLWKGRRFPLETCISGWAMLNRRAAVIEDIYADDRIPHEAYRPTFVRSLAVVPIRTRDPIGAIGNYWASRHRPSEEEVELLQALADSTAVAIENVRLYEELEQRVAGRTVELEELSRSARALSDEVRTPLAAARAVLRSVLERGGGTDVAERLRHVDAALAEAIETVGRPLADACAGRDGAADTDGPPAGGRTRLLVADDHPLICTLLERTFGDAGYDVLVESVAERVAEAVERWRPSVAVVDVQMWPSRPFHALEAVADLEPGVRPAILVLSGHDEPAVRERALELGADAFRLKPWNHQELLDLVATLVSERARSL